MQEKGTFIIGAGGFARETLTIYEDLGKLNFVNGFVEENTTRAGEFLNGKQIYDFPYLLSTESSEKNNLIIAIGSNARNKIVKKLENLNFSYDTVIHPSAIIHKTIELGFGCIITAGVILTTNIKIGNHVILNLSVSIGHDSIISDYTTVSPGARISGNVKVGSHVFIGNNASINEGLRIGSGAVIGAGAVVTDDVPDLALVIGVPGKIRKIYDGMGDRPW